MMTLWMQVTSIVENAPSPSRSIKRFQNWTCHQTLAFCHYWSIQKESSRSWKKTNRFVDCSTPMTEYSAIWEVLNMAVIRNPYRIIIQSDFQLTVNVIYDKIIVSKEIINLMEEIWNMCYLFKEVIIRYYNRICNREAY